jgi:guanine nucleotide-binding protein subunit alpha
LIVKPPLLCRSNFVLTLISRLARSFFAEAQRIAAEDYVPSIEDIGHASEKGVMETHVNVDQLSIRISQVYGQQGCFRKWIHLFEGVTSVMFCASLSDYDEPGVSRRSRRVSSSLFVAPNMYDQMWWQTRLVDSLIFFEAIVNSPWFKQTSIILFLTGMDDFRAKLHEVYPKILHIFPFTYLIDLRLTFFLQVPLSDYFPEYTGGTDADEGARCILTRFRELNHFPLQVYSQ